MEALQRLHNRGSISTGYDIDNSYKNENDNTERMYRPWGGITANTRTWTVSLWVKRTELGACYTWGAGVSGNDVLVVDFDSDDRLGFRSTISATNDCVYRTNRVFRDTSAWYHLVFAVDTTSSTAGNRLRIYVNGVEETSFATETNFDQNDLTMHNANGSYMEVGAVIGESPRFNGYIAEVNSITGTQYAPTAFGEFDEDSGIWKPIKFTGSYAENSVFLEFKDSSSLGTDTSGNGQTFTLQNLSAADQATDTPTNNFCTFNPLVRVNNNPTISEGGMKVTGGGGTWNQAFGTIGVANGKWYFEVKVADASDTGYFGLSTFPAIPDNVSSGQLMYNTSFMVGASSGIDYYYWQSGSQTSNESTGWGNLSNGDVLGFAIDLDSSTKTCKVYKNNTALSGTAANPFDLPTNMQTEFLFPMYVQYEQNLDYWRFGGWTENVPDSAASDANGYGTFEYAPPSGYLAICSQNLASSGGTA